MTTTYWFGGAQNTAQQATILVNSIPVGGTLTATINGKTVRYTGVSGDTVSTAAAAWQALLSSSDAPAEFQEISFSVSTATITAVANTPGTPFTLTTSAGAGASLTQTETVANQSVSDIADARNWRRGGLASLPQRGDDVVLADSDVPLLWNLDALKSVGFNSLTRWQTFTASVGLPDQSAGGYNEYRPKYFQLTGAFSGSSSSSAGGSGGVLQVVLGAGPGQGPTRERYDSQGQQTNLVLLASGSPADAYAVTFLTTNGASTVSVIGSSLGVAMFPGEVTTLASAQAASGTLALGPGCTVLGSAYASGANLLLQGCAPQSVSLDQGAQLSQTTVASAPQLTYPSLTAQNGSQVTWRSGSGITTLNLFTSSFFDKGQDLRPMQVTNCTIDASTAQVSDPFSVVTYLNPPQARDSINAGPFLRGPNSTIKVA